MISLYLDERYNEGELISEIRKEFDKQNIIVNSVFLEEKILKPFAFFRYHSLTKKDGEQKEVFLFLLIDSTNNAVVDEKLDISSLKTLKPDLEKFRGVSKIRSIFSEKDIEEIAKIKISALKNLEKNSVVIYDKQFFYVPFYIFKVFYRMTKNSKREEVVLTLNSNTKKIYDELPVKREHTAELFSELVEELKNPAKVVSYFFESVKHILFLFWKLFVSVLSFFISWLFGFVSFLYLLLKHLSKIAFFRYLFYLILFLVFVYLILKIFL